MQIDIQKLKSGNIRSLSKFITLIESKKAEHQKEAQELLNEILPLTGKSIRIGISGTPGVGKSTFIESLGLLLINKGLKVAVLAIDPSSPLSGGSLLGDKTRMEKLAQEKNAFIRPTPSSGNLGGVALKTREVMLACEAAGYDVVLIETVGVGQSEYDVANIVDLFTVLLLPGGGDELQGIKKGIIELCDNIVINKADGDNKQKAHDTMVQYKSALGVIKTDRKIGANVMMASALENKGVTEYWDLIEKIYQENQEKIQLKRKRQNQDWLKKLFNELLENRVRANPSLQSEWTKLNDNILNEVETPLSAANKLIHILFNN
ncbi:methylmalonyl Co-A mutase-associated GTPase MeaB [Halobacteriovorax sp. XZX-3]|uniref:methylmalonyl Co-A mutase-associated GTPase MeaB n=1 Tax=unclassified Halobacteriovorax TaxID=2639665 RepID=UPI000CD31CC2|nr:methylmalonyl Co-A mutase-associated GTPase MeaB [Halobacteriovorax sp. DA5]POB12423.1 methylmalonyl Co-A mutase-associated GTPase MeaB [Halobacteriovorax sp. DA5]